MQPGQQPYYPQPSPPAKKSSAWIIILVVVLGGGVLLVGTMASLGIFGVRRYLAAAKTAEAKNTIGAITRGARAAYEREGIDGQHSLCASAVTVPSTVPSGRKYMPSSSGDFDSGDATTGWRCLKFSMTSPIYYQYSYSQGAGYLAGAIAPGATGFEAAARGDLDGDGETSLFALSGKVSGGTITMSQMHIENEVE